MKQSAARIRPLLLLSGAALAGLVLLLWSGGGQQTARAYPGLTVAIDMDPSTTTDTNGDGLYETVDTGTFESCVDITDGQQFDVVVSVLDVLDLTAFMAGIEYDGSVVKIIGAYTGTTPSNLPTMFMSAQPLSDVQNESQNYPAPATGELLTPDIDGKYEAAAFDPGYPDTGHDGSGILVRLTLEATAAGVSPFNIDTEDIDGDGDQDRGVMLRDVNGVILNDPADGLDNDGDTLIDEDLIDGEDNDGDTLIDEDWGDGFFDGPFINASSTIAVDQPDSNGNGISDICDPDMDGDGYDNDVDNCPEIPNGAAEAGIPGVGDQTDTDGDGKGDPCDPDADADWYPKTMEQSYGSMDWDATSTPEVCDTLDNDKDGSIDEGSGDPPIPFADIDADTIPDCGDDNVDTDGDGTYNLFDDDIDGDETLNEAEHKIPTDACVACNDGIGYPDWPQDFNDDKVINVVDLNKLLPPPLGSWGGAAGNEPYSVRRDLDHNGVINLVDLNQLLPAPLGAWGTTCGTP